MCCFRAFDFVATAKRNCMNPLALLLARWLAPRLLNLRGPGFNPGTRGGEISGSAQNRNILDASRADFVNYVSNFCF